MVDLLGELFTLSGHTIHNRKKYVHLSYKYSYMMNQKEIQELIKFVSKSGVTEVEIEEKDFKITIKSEPKRSEEHTSELQSRPHLVCRLLLEKKKKKKKNKNKI